MTKENHYGIYVDSEVPITGVFQNNHVDWLHDEICGPDATSLDYEECLNSFVDEKVLEIQNILEVMDGETLEASARDIRDICDLLENAGDNIDCDQNNTTLIGFTRTFKNEKAWYWLDVLKYGYKLDENAEYSAIVGEIYTQVVKSKWLVKCRLCSPCYPGQGNADSIGEYLAYSLPPDMYDEKTPFRQRIFPAKGNLYRIFSVDECGCDSFWSNIEGWVAEGYTLFTEAEKEAFTELPRNATHSNWQLFRKEVKP